MYPLAVYWNSSQLWGLLLCQSLQAWQLPFSLLTATDIAQGKLLDKPPKLLLVPGGPANLKFQSLGAEGQAAIRQYVHQGGNYLGFCGGAGLALNSEQSLQLCPWQRAPINSRLEHFISGHVPVKISACLEHLSYSYEANLLGYPHKASLAQTHPAQANLVQPNAANQTKLAQTYPAQANSVSPAKFIKQSNAATQAEYCANSLEKQLPIFWPGRFAFQPHTDVEVLAHYNLPPLQDQDQLCRQWKDLWMADFPLAELKPGILTEWLKQYNVDLIPSFLHDQPCIIRGHYGKGQYILSYSHLETPDSPLANAWFKDILTTLAQVTPAQDLIPPWYPEGALHWENPTLEQAKESIVSLIHLGLTHGMLCRRTPWLFGWRQGMPGAGLNNLYLAIMTLLSQTPSPKAIAYLQTQSLILTQNLQLFCTGVEHLLLAGRLSQTVPEAVPKDILEQERLLLFGSAMRSGGLYLEIYQVLEKLVELNLQANQQQANQ